MEGASKYCGLGETFSAYHYEKSKKIGDLKIQGLKESRAKFVTTSCPGCIIQLQDSKNHAEVEVRTVHLLELFTQVLEN